MAILSQEPEAATCRTVLLAERDVLISAGTLAEALIVAGRRNLGDAMRDLLRELQLSIEAVSASSAEGVANAYARWGKGVHPARLNLGDCFAYELAARHGCPLLFVGDDFARTDIRCAI